MNITVNDILVEHTVLGHMQLQIQLKDMTTGKTAGYQMSVELAGNPAVLINDLTEMIKWLDTTSRFTGVPFCSKPE